MSRYAVYKCFLFWNTQVDILQKSALHNAAQNEEGGYIEIVDFLVNVNGVDLEIKESIRGATPLVDASNMYETKPDVILSLIRAGANIEARDHRNRTALIGASVSGSVDVVKVLIEAGANVEATYANGVRHLLSFLQLSRIHIH